MKQACKNRSTGAFMAKKSEVEKMHQSSRRFLSLLYALGGSKAGLSTGDIVDDEMMGYTLDTSGKPSKASRQSRKKKFERDKEVLAALGFTVERLPTPGSKATDERRWKVRMPPAPYYLKDLQGKAQREHLQLMADEIKAYLDKSDDPQKDVLWRAAVKIACVAGNAEDLLSEEKPRRAAELDAVRTINRALSNCRAFVFDYRNAAGRLTKKRSVKIYGLFSQDGKQYFSGFDDARNDTRTFRIDRVSRVYALGDPYEMPDNFDVNARRFFSLDASDMKPVDVVLSFPQSVLQEEIASITMGAGSIEVVNGKTYWKKTVRNLDAAADLCLGHAQCGMRPEGPEGLVSLWREKAGQAVEKNE